MQKLRIMKKTITYSLLSLAALLMLTVYACNKDDDGATPSGGNNGGQASVNFMLTDNPANYDAVYIDIQQVEVTMEGSAAVVLDPVRPGIYDLLKFRNGLDTLLVRADVPAGRISQIRLILGPNNSVVVDGNVEPLKTPSAQQSGLKLNLNQRFEAGGSYTVWIDFDAGKSIVETGNGKYNLKPVIRAYSALTDGRIKGYVTPLQALVTVYADNGVDTYAAIPDANGYFVFAGLPEGTYTITYDAAAAGYLDVVVNGINVTYGNETDLGTQVIVQ